MTSDRLGIAERAVRAARKAGVEAAEAFVTHTVEGSVSLEKNDFSTAEWSEEFGIALRVYREARLGFAYVTHPDRISAGITDALKASRLSKPLKGFRFPAARSVPTVGGLHDAGLEDVDGASLVREAESMLDAAQEVRKDLNVAGGGASIGWGTTAVANSEGVSVSYRETGMSGSCYIVQSKHGVSTGFASQESRRRDVRLDRIGREAAELAVRAEGAVKLEKGGVLPCVVRPEPAGDLLSTVTLASLEGKAAHRNESFYSGKRDRTVAHPKLSIVQDPRAAGGLGSSPVDDEGVPSRAVRPIANGMLKTFLYDAATAREYGGSLTSSAVRAGRFDGRSYKAPPSAEARQVRFVAPSRSTEKLVRSIDRGLLVHDLMGVHTANAVSGDFSVTSSLLFLIEKGEATRPLQPVGVAANLHQELRRGITLGDDVKRMNGGAGLDLPSVLFEGFTVIP